MPDTDVFGGHSSQKIGGSPKHNPVDRTLDGGSAFPCVLFFFPPLNKPDYTHIIATCAVA